MDAAAFVDKWGKSRRSGRSASQEHFLDLCEVLKHPKPGAVDPKGLRTLVHLTWRRRCCPARATPGDPRGHHGEVKVRQNRSNRVVRRQGSSLTVSQVSSSS